MSQYADFYLRHNDIFIPLASHCGSSIIYGLMHEYAPWEKIRPMSLASIKSFQREAYDKAEEWEESKRKYQERKVAISTFNNSVEDKLEAIWECDRDIEEIQQEIDEAVQAQHFFDFLEDIIQASNEETINLNEYIYVGIECGHPTLESIVNG